MWIPWRKRLPQLIFSRFFGARSGPFGHYRQTPLLSWQLSGTICTLAAPKKRPPDSPFYPIPAQIPQTDTYEYKKIHIPEQFSGMWNIILLPMFYYLLIFNI
jgi:hypothetical protein